MNETFIVELDNTHHVYFRYAWNSEEDRFDVTYYISNLLATTQNYLPIEFFVKKVGRDWLSFMKPISNDIHSMISAGPIESMIMFNLLNRDPKINIEERRRLWHSIPSFSSLNSIRYRYLAEHSVYEIHFFESPFFLSLTDNFSETVVFMRQLDEKWVISYDINGSDSLNIENLNELRDKVLRDTH